jgi:methylmalonyl-CoA mutase
LEVLKSGWLQEEITAVQTKREQDVFTRKQSIVGTNMYANLAEAAGPASVQRYNNYLCGERSTRINIRKINNVRLSEPFEKLRKLSEEIKNKSGSKPNIGMICLGELKNYKPRLDFMKGFVAAGGIEAVDSGSITSLESAKQFILRQDTKYFCFCGSNDQYESFGHEILSTLNIELPDLTFYLAGLPEKDLQTKWESEGIKQFIHINSDCYDILSNILTEMEVALDERTKA